MNGPILPHRQKGAAGNYYHSSQYFILQLSTVGPIKNFLRRSDRDEGRREKPNKPRKGYHLTIFHTANQEGHRARHHHDESLLNLAVGAGVITASGTFLFSSLFVELPLQSGDGGSVVPIHGS